MNLFSCLPFSCLNRRQENGRQENRGENMPRRQIPNTDQNYYLINFDSDGKERAADDGQTLSEVILDQLKNQPVSDVFVMSHGWLGDIDDAQGQYDRWLANLWSCADDIEAVKRKRPNFKPLSIGLHWP